MQPTLCSRCKKNIAVVFISKIEDGNQVNEGLCLRCATEINLPQVKEMMERMGITEEDLDNIGNEMLHAFGGAEEAEDLPVVSDEEEEDSGKTATFPFLNRLFGNAGNPPAPTAGESHSGEEAPKSGKRGKNSKFKFLDSYCINLTASAR